MRIAAIASLLCLSTAALAAERPAWIDKPEQPGKLCAVGRGKSENEGVALDKATMQARSELMRTLGSTMKTVITKTFVDVKDHLTGKMKKEEYVKTVTSITSSGALIGSSVDETWVDPETQTGHALVCMDADALRRTIKANLSANFNKHGTFKKDQAEQALNKLTQAVDSGVK